MTETTIHEQFMNEAIALAQEAMAHDEVPVGAVVVKGGEIIGRGCNNVETGQSVAAHAEMVAITKAAKKTGSWRLTGCVLYTTLEPCAMCAGAIVLSRLEKLVFGAEDPKSGAAGSVINVFQPGLFNHDVEVVKGILEPECSRLLTNYFRSLRNRKNSG